MIVVADASALVEYLLRTAPSESVRKVIEAEATDIHVPALCDVEVVSALRSALASRRLTEARAFEALETYLDLPLTRSGHEWFVVRMLELRANFSAYDAVYVALAEKLAAPLLTGDDRLARSAVKYAGLAVLPGR